MKNSASKFIVSGEEKITVYVKNDKIYKVGRKRHEIEIEQQVNDEYIIGIDGKKHLGELFCLKQNQCVVIINGNTYNLTIETELAHKRSKKINTGEGLKMINLTAPLPGVVSDIFVGQNQKVNKDEPLFTLEAMKMQNEIKSPVKGIVKKLLVNPGDSVSKDQFVLEIENV